MSKALNIKSLLKKHNINKDSVNSELQKSEKKVKAIWNDEEKIQKILQASTNICMKLSNLPAIGTVFRDIPLLCMMINDYRKGAYKSVPLATIISATAAVAYLVSPIDFIPDALPFIGALDDWAVISYVLYTLHNDIEDYRIWKSEEGVDFDPITNIGDIEDTISEEIDDSIEM